MRGYRVFLKKELFEAFKTYRLLVMGAAFLVFGIMSPLAAKMLPEIIRWATQVDPTTAGMDLGSLFTEPSAIDAWAQFYSNVGQLGLIVLVVAFGGMVSSELAEGKLSIILTKGLSRSAAILSKLTSCALVWTGSLAVAFFTSWGYTAYFFPGEKLPYLPLAGFCLWLFGVFLLALLAFVAALAKKSTIACLLAMCGSVIALNLLNLIPYVEKYNPVSLGGSPMLLISGSATPRGVYPAMATAVVGIAALALLAVMAFNVKATPPRRLLAFALSLAAALSLAVVVGEGVPSQIRLGMRVVTEKVAIGAGTQWELQGLLTLPKGAEGKSPAVVLVHGSGSTDMDETIFDNKPFREIAEHLSSNGIAVIRYNKRTYTYGLRLSEQGDGGFTVWDETIEDAILATGILKSDPRIDEGRVFILGHSLGGMLAPRIHAMGGDYAGLILLAGSPRFLLDIMKDQQAAVFETMEDGEDKAAAVAESEKFNASVESALALPDEEAKAAAIEGIGMSGYYFKDLRDNPASAYIEGIDAPFLVMHAGSDLQVTEDVDFALYKELLAGRPNVEFKLYDGLNHLFMPAKAGDITELMDEYKVKAKVDKQALRDIEEWIKAH